MQKTLILWDIDGTFLHSAGAGMRALQLALGDVFGVSGSFEGIDFAGKDGPPYHPPDLCRYGIDASREISPANRGLHGGCFPGCWAGATEDPARSQRADPRDAGHPHVAQGLLTGNLRRGAETKLGFHGLWEYFPIGAFADDSETRNDLGPFALERARSHWGLDFQGESVWIVGDTPHDIACARAFGGRVLAVATGKSPASDLARYNPDAVLESLADTQAFWRVIGA